MLRSPQVTFSLFKLYAVLLLPVFLSGCAVVFKNPYHMPIFIKKAPKNQPFVLKSNVKVEGPINRTEKQELQNRLENQLDDSMKVRVSSYPVWKTIKSPPAFDTLAIRRSETFLYALLHSLGYFGATITDTFTIKRKERKKQDRVTVDFTVTPGKGLKFDSVGYALDEPAWQDLVMKNRKESLLRKDDPYSKYVVGKELDRVIELLRNNGYFKMGKEDIYAEADTVAFGLIDPTLDPFEQAVLMQELQKKQEKPTIKVVVRQRPLKDSSHIKPYYINTVTIYPDVPFRPDTVVQDIYDTTRFG